MKSQSATKDRLSPGRELAGFEPLEADRLKVLREGHVCMFSMTSTAAGTWGYATLTLARDGLMSVERSRGPDGHQRSLYRITPAGHEYLAHADLRVAQVA